MITTILRRQYGFDVQHEWDFRGGKDYFIAGVLGKRETYRTKSGPYYGNPHRNSYAILWYILLSNQS